MMIFSTSHTRGITVLLFILFSCKLPLLGQVTIREKVTIHPGSTNIVHSGTSAPVVTWTLTYGACEGYKDIYIAVSPCNAYHQSASGSIVHGNRNGETGRATFTFIAYDEGIYGINVENHTQPCIVSSTCDPSNCWESASITVDGVQLPGAGFSFYNSYSNVCSSEELQPQTFDENSFQVVSDGQTFTGAETSYDYVGNYAYGNPCQENVTVCPPLITPPDCEYTFGITGTENYNISTCLPGPTFSELNVCFNSQANKWHFLVQGLNVPIISTVCSVTDFIDIGDGTNTQLLQQLINDCSDYNRVIDALKIWIMHKAGHLSPCPPNEPPYYSINAELVHEAAHLSHYKQFIRIMMDGVLQGKVDISRNDGECLTDVINNGTINLRREFIKNYGIASDAMQSPKVPSDSFAEIAHVNAYKEIRTRIQTWAKINHQDWFNQAGDCVN